jgi:hypothetical protein
MDSAFLLIHDMHHQEPHQGDANGGLCYIVGAFIYHGYHTGGHQHDMCALIQMWMAHRHLKNFLALVNYPM